MLAIILWTVSLLVSGNFSWHLHSYLLQDLMDLELFEVSASLPSTNNPYFDETELLNRKLLQ